MCPTDGILDISLDDGAQLFRLQYPDFFPLYAVIHYVIVWLIALHQGNRIDIWEYLAIAGLMSVLAVVLLPVMKLHRFRLPLENSDLHIAFEDAKRALGIDSEYELWVRNMDSHVLITQVSPFFRAILMSEPVVKDLLTNKEMSRVVFASELCKVRRQHPRLAMGLAIPFYMCFSLIDGGAILPIDIFAYPEWHILVATILFTIFMLLLFGILLKISAEDLKFEDTIESIFGVSPENAYMTVFSDPDFNDILLSMEYGDLGSTEQMEVPIQSHLADEVETFLKKHQGYENLKVQTIEISSGNGFGLLVTDDASSTKITIHYAMAPRMVDILQSSSAIGPFILAKLKYRAVVDKIQSLSMRISSLVLPLALLTIVAVILTNPMPQGFFIVITTIMALVVLFLVFSIIETHWKNQQFHHIDLQISSEFHQYTDALRILASNGFTTSRSYPPYAKRLEYFLHAPH